MEELDKAQKEQDSLQDELEAMRESLDVASREFNNCWANLDGASTEMATAGHSTKERASICGRHARGYPNSNARPTTIMKGPGLTGSGTDVL